MVPVDAPASQETDLDECIGAGDSPLAVSNAKNAALDALVSLDHAAWDSLDKLRKAQNSVWVAVMQVIAASPELVLGEAEYVAFVAEMAGVKGQGATAQDALITTTKASIGGAANRLVGQTLKAVGKGSSLGAAFARQLSSGLGGFIVSVAAGLALGALMSLLSKSRDEEIADIARAGARAAGVATQLIDDSADKARVAWTERSAALKQEIQASGDLAALEGLARWIGHLKGQLPSTMKPQVLQFQLLETWALQHAGDEDSPNETTNEAVWGRAAGALDKEDPEQAKARGSQWRRVDGKLQKPDLFRDQLTLAMGRAGLDTGPMFAALEAGRKRVVSHPGSNRRRPQAPIVVKYAEARDHARWSSYASSRWHGFPHFESMPLGDGASLTPRVEVSVVLGTNEQATTVWVDKLSFLVANKAQQRLAWWEEPL